MRKVPETELLEIQMRDAAKRGAAEIWYDVDETIPEASRRPHTFVLVGAGFGTQKSRAVATEAIQRLMSGESARQVRAKLKQRQLVEMPVKLAGTAEELEQHLLGHFRVGHNSVELGGSHLGRGKHISWCYTYHSTDHNLF